VEDGETGILVPARDAAQLAPAIEALLLSPDLARRMGQAGKRRMAEHFSLDGMARATERLYRSLLDGRRFETETDPGAALRHEAV
jgi:glycosyltransferase involved in cell wall biosynthesis